MLDEVESNGVDYAHNLPSTDKRVSLRRNTGDDSLTWEQLDNNFEVLRAKLNEVLQLLNDSALVDSSTRLGKKTQTIAFEDIPIKTINSDVFTIDAVASSGLPVTLTSMNDSIATISGNTVTVVSGGEVVIEASQEGSDDYFPAQNAREILTVTKSNNVITFPEPIGAIGLHVGTYSLNATASSGLDVTYISSNDLVAEVDGSTLDFKTAGIVTVTAMQAGDTSYKEADPVTQTFTISDASNDVLFDDFLTISSGVSASASNLGDLSITTSGDALSPSGKLYYDSYTGSGLPDTFILYLDEAKTIGFQLTTTGTPLGMVRFLKDDGTNYEVDLSQLGSGESAVMTQVGIVPIVKEDQTITWGEVGGAAALGYAITLDGTSSSGLPVTYEYDNSATASNNIITLDQVGSFTITAKQVGNNLFNPAPDVVLEFVVTAPVTVNFTIRAINSLGNTI